MGAGTKKDVAGDGKESTLNGNLTSTLVTSVIQITKSNLKSAPKVYALTY